MEITAKIQTILSKSTVQTKDKEYLTQTFTVEVGTEKYPKILAITIFNNENALETLETLQSGDTATFSLDLSSKEYNGRYYHNINCYKIANIEKGANNNFYPVEADEREADYKSTSLSDAFVDESILELPF
jgi:hypothetical protein